MLSLKVELANNSYFFLGAVWVIVSNVTMSVSLSVCLLVYLKCHMSKLHTTFRSCYDFT